MTTVAELSFALIASFEGLRLFAYPDSGDKWTIGLGHTGSEVIKGLIWTPEQASVAYQNDSYKLIQAVQLSQYSVVARSALVSFGYNCGMSKMINVLQGRDSINNPVHTTDEHGTVLAGLVTRRRLEYALFKS